VVSKIKKQLCVAEAKQKINACYTKGEDMANGGYNINEYTGKRYMHFCSNPMALDETEDAMRMKGK